MKTNANLSNLKKVAVTMCFALALTAASFTQPKPESKIDDEMVAISRLDARMDAAEESARFVAPAVDEITPEMERLDVMADQTEVALKYVAPAVAEEEVFTPELVRLELLADATEASIRFKAPRADEGSVMDNTTENATEVIMAEKTK